MAFGDKLPEFKPAEVVAEIFTDIFAPLPEVKERKASVSVTCCEDPMNMSVKHGVGTCFCLKCRSIVTAEHFKRVLGI